MICGIIFSTEGYGPRDPYGCRLDANHTGPHEFVAGCGTAYQWETDWECDCDHCMKCEGDYCSIYWKAERPATQEGRDKEGGN